MSILTNPTEKSPERAFALQQYLLLHSQHDALQKRLESISSHSTATSPSETSSSPRSTSPDSPPSHSHHNHHRRARRFSTTCYRTPSISPIAEFPPALSSSSPRHSRPPLLKRRSSLPPTLSTASDLSAIEAEELKLISVNQQIKSTLTDLLNCESVRRDRRYSMWIQTRLLDAERELKGSRSRSRQRSSVDADAVVCAHN